MIDLDFKKPDIFGKKSSVKHRVMNKMVVVGVCGTKYA
jgi:hypothetical protein